MRKLAAEGLATFGLVLFGTGACVVNAATGGSLGVVGIALVFGLSVFALASAFGAISGAHMNPAVTLALWRARRFPAREVGGHLAAQLAGALAASVLLLTLFGARAGDLGATRPAFGAAAAFWLELAMTFLLVLVVLRAPAPSVPAAAGAVVALEAMFGGPVSGASMNPVRSLAPAVVSGRLDGLWLYLLAPLAGALLAAAASDLLDA